MRVFNRMKAENVKSKLILQVHDELNFSVVPGEEETMQRIVIEEMSNVLELKVPLLADCAKTGDFDGELLKAIGIPREKFGEMVNPGTVIGTLTSQIQQYTGHGAVPVIAVAGHDTASAVIAVPSPDKDYA